jgi:hypothetical protein
MGPGLGHWRQQADQPVFLRGARYADHELCSQGTLKKRKQNFPHILGNSDEIGWKVICEEGLPNI